MLRWWRWRINLYIEEFCELLFHPLMRVWFLLYARAKTLSAAVRALSSGVRALAASRTKAEKPLQVPDRGIVISRSFIGQDGAFEIITLADQDDPFDRRSPLVSRDAEGRMHGW